MITWQHVHVTDDGDEIPKRQRVSRLDELADASGSAALPRPEQVLAASPAETRSVPPDPKQADEVAAARREFARLLGEFRRTAVVVPFDEYGSLWTADFNGVRWICAFSDEEALARFAAVRGDAGREWTYRTILGARLLDVMVPLLPGPGGVALDAGSATGVLFPPVPGIVPDEVAVKLEGETP
ncbi:SseB family protein [Streptomyces sp. NPDC047928]|uniref:SseB family protein n=1 Tax=unclassified Streptomyces TaxID=2593676 RepID=UPI0037164C34